jgi:hypothetical protein
LVLDLQAVAGGLNVMPQRRHYDQPEYFSVFGHYATAELTDPMVVKIETSEAHFSKEFGTLDRSLRLAASGLPVVDLDILIHVIQFLQNESGGACSVGLLISKVATPGANRGIVRRHILWLIKHGFVRVVETV